MASNEKTIEELLEYQENIEREKKIITYLEGLPVLGAAWIIGVSGIGNILLGWKGLQRTRMRAKIEGYSDTKTIVLSLYYGVGKIGIGLGILTLGVVAAPIIAAIASCASVLKSAKSAWDERHKGWKTQVRNWGGLILETAATALLIASLFTPIGPAIITAAAIIGVAAVAYKTLPLLTRWADSKLKKHFKGYRKSSFRTGIKKKLRKRKFQQLKKITQNNVSEKELELIKKYAQSLQRHLEEVRENQPKSKLLNFLMPSFISADIKNTALADYHDLQGTLSKIIKKSNPHFKESKISKMTEVMLRRSLNKLLENPNDANNNINDDSKLLEFINHNLIQQSNEKMREDVVTAQSQAPKETQRILKHLELTPDKKVSVGKAWYKKMPLKNNSDSTVLKIKDSQSKTLYETTITPTELKTTVKSASTQDLASIFRMYKESGAEQVTLNSSDPEEIKTAIKAAKKAGFEDQNIIIADIAESEPKKAIKQKSKTMTRQFENLKIKNQKSAQQNSHDPNSNVKKKQHPQSPSYK